MNSKTNNVSECDIFSFLCIINLLTKLLRSVIVLKLTHNETKKALSQ